MTAEVFVDLHSAPQAQCDCLIACPTEMPITHRLYQLRPAYSTNPRRLPSNGTSVTSMLSASKRQATGFVEIAQVAPPLILHRSKCND
jgi:hypothetical protein